MNSFEWNSNYFSQIDRIWKRYSIFLKMLTCKCLSDMLVLSQAYEKYLHIYYLLNQYELFYTVHPNIKKIC